MSIKKVKKEFAVWLKEDWGGYFEGSCLHVAGTSKNFYYGIQTSMAGSFYSKFLKQKCTKTNPLDEMRSLIKKYVKTPEGKKKVKEMKKIASK